MQRREDNTSLYHFIEGTNKKKRKTKEKKKDSISTIPSTQQPRLEAQGQPAMGLTFTFTTLDTFNYAWLLHFHLIMHDYFTFIFYIFHYFNSRQSKITRQWLKWKITGLNQKKELKKEEEKKNPVWWYTKRWYWDSCQKMDLCFRRSKHIIQSASEIVCL